MCGIGTSSWFVNYQSLVQFSCDKDDIAKKTANIRTLFETIGFLIPSISLAVIHAILPDNEEIFSITAYFLGTLAFLFYFLSFKDVIALAAKSDSTNQSNTGIWQSIKLLWESSVPRYFSLNTILHALINILGTTMAILTTEYFGLKEDSLWVGAIGIPIGGILSSVKALVLEPTNDSLRFYSSSFFLILINALLFAFAGVAVEFFEAHSSSAYVTMFFFSATVGYFFCEMWAVAFTCWLKELDQFAPTEISRGNSLHVIGSQVVLAITFQLQTLSIDAIEKASIGEIPKAYCIAAAIFGTFIFLVLVCNYIYASRPALIHMSKFGWPMTFPYNNIAVKVVSKLTKSSVDELLFAAFLNFRTKSLRKELTDDTLTDGGALSSPPCSLQFSDFVNFLKAFEQRNSRNDSGDTFYANNEKVNMTKVIFSNSEAFETRMNLVEKATKSIVLLTWGLHGEKSIELINEVIRKHRELGVDVKVMVDGANFYYYCLLLNSTDGEDNKLMAIQMLTEEGIDVKFLLEDVGNAKYRCGSHSKILLVDDMYMIAGGRNMEDSFMTDEGTYVDTDLVLEGNFTHSAKRMLDKLWQNGTHVLEVFQNITYLDKIYYEMDPLSASIIAHPLSLSMISKRKPPIRSSMIRSITNTHRPRASETNAMLISLHHVTGRTDGIDIIYSTVLKLIECATNEINLVYGYFALFPPMEKAISAAIERGVRVKLFTNSSETGDIFFLRPFFAMGQKRLFEMGADICHE
ncbi:hypothetical protein CTEN210_02941 [Chaetoceros tenuissimus]|uniref:PLD phosphodiesterase domain-containing protein n=1 Tax=Chaetoceros tenuissimus TaxID=426638 RepID=A0AAD3CHZ3_9STRA|nr:hypothetical protein CTEN210_02941 [Chaetoceros tenuissimus]